MFGKKTFLSLLILVIAYFLGRYFIKPPPAPVITTQLGDLSGVIHRSRSGRNYHSYLGIPYAKPPVGDRRFESPVPAEPWNGLRDGSKFQSNCLQFDLMMKRIAGEEDCLYLNVYRPAAPSTAGPLKVMVFFHGGIFHFGSGNAYNPKYFMDEDIIIVTVNYRLGALGFLNTMDGKVNGNMGLKDQAMALKWVQENIASFGGNKDSVCIFGESAGGVSVHLHLLSPMSQGLFHCAISQSGNAVAHWAINQTPREQALRFAAQLNCPTDNAAAMVDCFKRIDPIQLVDVHQEVLRPLREWITLYAPTVELPSSPDPFLPQHPRDMLQNDHSGLRHDIPYMIGVNSHDGLLVSAGLFRNETMIQRLMSEFDVVASKLLNLEAQDDRKKIDVLHNYYTDIENGIAESAMVDPFTKFENYTNLFSDRMFFVPAHQSAKFHAKRNPFIYLYYYSFPRDQSLANLIMAVKGRLPAVIEVTLAYVTNWIKINIFGLVPENWGSCHADELALLYPMPWSSEITPSHKDYEMSTRMVKLWTTFGMTQEPLKFGQTPWEPVKLVNSTSKLKYLNIMGVEPEMIEEPFHDRVQLWNSLAKIK